MATLYGVNKTKINAGTTIPAGQSVGKVRKMYDQITLAAAQIGDIIQLGDLLPIGAKVLGLQLFTAALGSGVTVKVGDAASSNRYIAAVACNTANQVKVIDNNAAVGTDIDAANKQQILAEIAGAAATGLLQVVIEYIENN